MPERGRSLLVRADERVDEGRRPHFLQLRRLALRLEGEDGWLSDEGVWEFVERPKGLDAVVVVIHRKGDSGTEVLLRRGLRVPASVGRPGQLCGPGRHPALFVEEIVAGLVEEGESTTDGLLARAQREIEEETGLHIERSAIQRLGGPLWATPGLCAEVLHYFAADATAAEPRVARGDGSPFEALATIAWYPLAVAIDRVCGRGRSAEDPTQLGDLRAELGLRRLAAELSE